MKDKKIFKKWWFWVIVIVVALGIIGSFGQTDNKTKDASQTDDTQQTSSGDKSILPKLSIDDYKGKEGLVAYKELKGKGYKVEAEFEKQALTDMNGKASDVFGPLDVNKPDDRLSVDAFVVGSLAQDGDSVVLTIAHQPTN